MQNRSPLGLASFVEMQIHQSWLNVSQHVIEQLEKIASRHLMVMITTVLFSFCLVTTTCSHISEVFHSAPTQNSNVFLSKWGINLFAESALRLISCRLFNTLVYCQLDCQLINAKSYGDWTVLLSFSPDLNWCSRLFFLACYYGTAILFYFCKILYWLCFLKKKFLCELLRIILFQQSRNMFNKLIPWHHLIPLSFISLLAILMTEVSPLL